MLASTHQDLKSQLVTACLEIFPEALGIVLWGGAVASDKSGDGLQSTSDVDVIIEVDVDFSQEVTLASRLKTLIQRCDFCRLDPFVYLTNGSPSEPLEFIAPFGFYKANPFIPYMIQTQHAVIYGKSQLLSDRPEVSLSESLLGQLPQVLSSLRRLRMDAQVEQAWAPVLGKHKASLFVMLRTYYAFECGGIGSKKEALNYFAKTMPRFQPITDALWNQLYPQEAREISTEPSTELLLDFVKDLHDALQAAKIRETAH